MALQDCEFSTTLPVGGGGDTTVVVNQTNGIIGAIIVASATGVPAVTLPSAVSAGNIVVAMAIGYASSPSVNTSDGWTEVAAATHNPAVLDPGTRLCWKYFPAGGTQGQSPFVTGGTIECCVAAWEVRGLDPTFTPDVHSVTFSSPVFGAGAITLTDSSPASGLYLMMAGQLPNSGDPGAGTLTGLFTVDDTDHVAGGAGGTAAHKAYTSTPGGPVSETLTFGGGASAAGIMIGLSLGSVDPTGTSTSTPSYVPSGVLTEIKNEGTTVETLARSMDFVGAALDATSDGAGNVTVTLNATNDTTLAGDSADAVPTEHAVKGYALTGSTGSTDNRLLRSDGTGGKTAQASAITVDDNGGIQLPADFSLTGDISPSQITSNQNDYNPTNLATATVLRLTSDAARDVTGLQGGADGRLVVIANVGSNNIVLKDESTSSSAANRFALDGDLTLGGDTTATLLYDSTSSRWRLVAVGKASGGGSPGGSSGQVQYNNAGAFGGFTVSGDGALNTATGALTITKTSGTSFGYFATGTDAANLTGTVSVNRFNSGTGASSSTFLRGDGTWVTPTNTTYTADGSTLQLTSTTFSIKAGGVGTSELAADAVTYAKMQNVSATSRALGRKTAGSGDPEELTLSELLDFIGSAAQGDILYRGASAWARLPAGTSGQVLQTNGGAADPSWSTVSPGAGGALTKISESVLGSAQASVTFSSISGSYRDLVVVVTGRGDNGATSVLLLMRFNSDTGANYDLEFHSGNNTSSAAGASIAATSLTVGDLSAAGAPTNVASTTEAWVYNYAGTTFQKTVRSVEGFKTANTAAGSFVVDYSGWWRNTSAITSVTVFPSAGNFVTGTVVTLYGRG